MTEKIVHVWRDEPPTPSGECIPVPADVAAVWDAYDKQLLEQPTERPAEHE